MADATKDARITIRLEPFVLDLLDRAANAHGVSRAEAVRAGIVGFCEGLPRQDSRAVGRRAESKSAARERSSVGV